MFIIKLRIYVYLYIVAAQMTQADSNFRTTLRPSTR